MSPRSQLTMLAFVLAGTALSLVLPALAESAAADQPAGPAPQLRHAAPLMAGDARERAKGESAPQEERSAPPRPPAGCPFRNKGTLDLIV